MGRKIRIETYRPKKTLGVSTEDTLPVLVRVGGIFLALGGIIAFILSCTIMGVKSFFDVKQKIYNKSFLNKRRYVEVRIKKRKDGE